MPDEATAQEKKYIENLINGRENLSFNQQQFNPHVFRWILTNLTIIKKIPTDGIKIFNACFTNLNLSFLKTDFPLVFHGCSITKIDLTLANCRKLNIHNCEVEEIMAEEFSLKNSLEISASKIDNLRLVNARLSGRVQIQTSKFFSLIADDAIFNGTVCFENIIITKRMSFSSCIFHKEVHFKRTVFSGPHNKDVLKLDRITAKQNIVVIGAIIHGRLCMRNANIRAEFVLEKIKQPKGYCLDLSSTTISQFHDDISSWPPHGCLNIIGFEYKSFGDLSPNLASQRLDWLSRQFFPKAYRKKILTCVDYMLGLSDASGGNALVCKRTLKKTLSECSPHVVQISNKVVDISESQDTIVKNLRQLKKWSGILSPQPYLQCANALKYNGDIDGANEVMIEAQKEKDRLKPYISPLRFLWGRVTGYGYKPHRLLWTSGILLAISFIFFCCSKKLFYPLPFPEGDGAVWKNVLTTKVPPGYPTFYSFFYTLDIFVPFLDLQQASFWGIGGCGFWPGFLRIWANILSISGWILVGLGITAVSNKIRDH